jgi:eukaryotic-like serine/threonine-protein kinase
VSTVVSTRYCIQQKLGSGGMADVFVALARGPEGFERPSVVKCIRPELAAQPAFVQLFIDEATISARLQHPNIVHVYDFGAMNGTYYLAMEQVLGRDLRWMLVHYGQRVVVPVPGVAVEIARQCCLALEYAHGLTAADGTPLRLVHRDISPANIMVTYDGTVKLLDFGVARTIDPARRAHTEAGVVKGKMSYLAPEQMVAHQVDGRCDLWSLGVVLYELLTWRRLFHGKTDVETVKQVLETPIAPPSARNRSVSPVLDRIVLRALERDPEKRYQNAGEMADDLERYLLLTRRSGRVMRRLMRDIFEPIWRESGTPDEPDTLLDPPLSESSKTIDAASCIIEVVAAETEAARRARRRRRWRTPLLLAAGFVATLFLGGAIAPRSLRAVERAERANASASTSANANAPNVSVSIDSIPQGALVYADGAPASLGETPLVVTLPRSRETLGYALQKSGFQPTAIKIIPDQDKPVLVPLAPTPSDDAPAGKTISRW